MFAYRYPVITFVWVNSFNDSYKITSFCISFTHVNTPRHIIKTSRNRVIKPYASRRFNKCDLYDTYNNNNVKIFCLYWWFEDWYYPKQPYNHTCYPKDNGLNTSLTENNHFYAAVSSVYNRVRIQITDVTNTTMQLLNQDKEQSNHSPFLNSRLT